MLCKGTCGTPRALGTGTSQCHLLRPCPQPGRQDMTPGTAGQCQHPLSEAKHEGLPTPQSPEAWGSFTMIPKASCIPIAQGQESNPIPAPQRRSCPRDAGFFSVPLPTASPETPKGRSLQQDRPRAPRTGSGVIQDRFPAAARGSGPAPTSLAPLGHSSSRSPRRRLPPPQPRT